MDDSLVTTTSLTKGWRLNRSDPAAASNPEDVNWSEAIGEAAVPGTVASTLIGTYDPDKAPDLDYDAFDWWYQCDFDFEPGGSASELVFDGLATIAEVWLNGEQILRSRNMFRSYRVNVSDQLAARNTLTIAFRSITQELKRKRPRPRWKTKLVAAQQLRWIRTTLLGRIPGWTPGIKPVGPWRDIRVEHCETVRPVELEVLPSVDSTTASVAVHASLETTGTSATGASLTVLGRTYKLPVKFVEDRISIDSQISLDDASLWSPQDPALHDYALSIQVDGQERELKSGTLGFRAVDVDRTDGRLCFRVNGHDIFCRGACWTTNDIISLSGDHRELRNCLELFRSAGGNMIRVGGTMVYENDTFYDICDELGIMIWQDFMFANMDYPSDDTDFLEDATNEISQQIQRLRQHPCIFAFCGNSEVEQQSAMFGMPPDLWRNDLFYVVIPELLDEFCPGIPYFPSSPCEGALPFHSATGPSHFFGVGAYRQPMASIESAQVKFTAECLAFSNVPSDRSLIRRFHTVSPAVHDPRWKAGVPRDSAAGWDFEDIRDHYIGELYGIDPIELRCADKERYIAISQVATGEIMEYAFNYWRGPQSQCNGALIWQLKDIVPGAGWGFLDSDGQPKPLYYFLKRCWGDTNLVLQDHGLDGLGVLVLNESDDARAVKINIQLLQHSRTVISELTQEFTVPSNEYVEYSVDELLGRFFDTTYQYRFGPPKHDVVVASLLDTDGNQQLTRCFFPNSHDIRSLDQAEIDINCETEGKNVRIEIRSDSCLQHVKLYSRTHDFDDNFFHLSPSISRIVTARPIADTDRPLRVVLSALNLSNPVAFS